MTTHQKLWLLRITSAAIFLLISNVIYSQCKPELLDDSSFCFKWRKDSTGENGFRSTNYMALSNCYMTNDTLDNAFKKLYRAKLLATLGQPNEIKNIRNNKNYCTDWWQEYIYYVDTASEFKHDTKGKSSGTYLSFVFDQCEKHVERISYGYYLRRKDYR